MQDYITSVVKNIISKKRNTTNLTIILPSKRAGVFVKQAYKKNLESFTFLPNIISIEDFIEQISKIQKIDNITVLFEFYKIYIENTPKTKIESFEIFSNWATTLIQDFNEIDRFLIDPKYIFSYIKDINRIEKWFTKKNPETTLTKNHLSFFDYVQVYYVKLYEHLIKLKKGYQGLQYREAEKNIDNYITENRTNEIIFVGFNALNKSEEIILKKLLDNNIAEIYFDIDEFYITEKIAAANFITKYKTDWKYFQKKAFKTVSKEFQKAKNIEVIGVPKNVSQIKHVGSILQKKIAKTDYDNTAIVLANESLLSTMLNSLPKEIKSANITMGYALKNIVLSDFFSLLFKLHLNKIKIGKNKTFYYKDVIALLKHNSLPLKTNKKIIQKLLNNNYILITKNELLQLVDNQDTNETEIIHLLFKDWKDSSETINTCIQVLEKLIQTTKISLETEYQNRFLSLFQQLSNLNQEYNCIKTLESLIQIYKQLLSTETLAFKGEALSGLQIMGMLETRVLDFETIIITSVNEGFLPGGKTNNSFIPFDVKQEVGLPTYHEKDSIFSYHFYHLLQRAKIVYLLYNTETDDFGSGEQSRFITQLEVLQNKLPKHTIIKTIVTPKVNTEEQVLKKIEKTEKILATLKEQAIKGFSPTVLTNYIYNPIAFYKQKVLKIHQLNEIEETIAANTLGTVIHRTLEIFYKPYKGKIVEEKDISEMKKNTTITVKNVFLEEFKNGDLTKGKNRLIFEITKQFITNFLNQELQQIKNGKQIKIIDIEVDLKTTINIEGIDFPITLKGQADRIDEIDGVLRIIDYKTGLVKQTDLNIKNWEEITTEHKNHKIFQVLLYAYMYAKIEGITFDNKKIESGVISFKNLKTGFMRVNKTIIKEEEIQKFEKELKNLILEIFNPKVPFIENENLPY